MNYHFEPGQTPIAEEEKLGLKLPLSTQAELDQVEQANIEQALFWLRGKRFSAEQVLSEKFLRQLHRQMFKDVWKWAGKFRQTEKNIGVSWIMVAREVRVLCDDAFFWVEHETYAPQEIALRFKHRLVSIHCFPNGNGRHSRMMADILLENVFGLPAFTWGAARLGNPTEDRQRYIAALKKADNGEVADLLAFAR